ncbi:hypothetical protein L7F22_034476 [Adiantum nelumboides]|nr:hypothetical protein [Adiantum nelumboides]
MWVHMNRPECERTLLSADRVRRKTCVDGLRLADQAEGAASNHPAAALVAMADNSKKTGKVKWFNMTKGFGFVTPVCAST